MDIYFYKSDGEFLLWKYKYLESLIDYWAVSYDGTDGMMGFVCLTLFVLQSESDFLEMGIDGS